MSFIARRQLSTLIPPKIASVKVCLFAIDAEE
ncbi:MAG: F0F1 ATP synthase subunit f [Asgard group archaeon]|nr:F0F1 ATP synthase subunit f [Asgard group archaeon]